MAALPDFASAPTDIARTVLGEEPGAVAVGVWRQGGAQIAVLRGGPGGAVAAEDETEPDAQPLFEIGSISKLFTGLLLAQAVERSDLDLDDTLGGLLHGQTPLKAETAAITLRQLVTHSACLPREAPGFPGYGTANPFADIDRQRLLAGLAGLALEHAPPCAAAYSNFGMGLLGQLLADRYGKPWATLVRENITAPVGMRNTVQAPGVLALRMASGRNHLQGVRPWDFDALAGAGALRSTASDLLLFARALMAGRAGPLGPAADRMLSPLGQFRGESIGYAVLIRGPAPHRTYYHDGLTGGFRALLVFGPDTQEAAAVLSSNTHAAPTPLLLGIMASRYPVTTAGGIAPPVPALAEYSGVYRVDGNTSFIFVAQDGALYRRISGGGFRPLSPAGVDIFVDAENGANFAFRRDAGRIVGVDLRQGGGGYAAERTDKAAPALAVVRPERQQDYVGQYLGKRLLRLDLPLDVRAENGQLGVRTGSLWRRPVFPVEGKPDRFIFEDGGQLQFERDAAGQVVGAVLYSNGVIPLRKRP